MRAEYVVEKVGWGDDQYRVEVYETHKNTPGFAPEEFEVHVCSIWLEYREWERRVEFNEGKVIEPETLAFILETFNGELNKSRHTRLG